MSERTKEELIEMIRIESENIADLEKRVPPYDKTAKYGSIDPVNREYLLWSIAVRDAYWRRRMLQTELDGGDKNATAKVY